VNHLDKNLCKKYAFPYIYIMAVILVHQVNSTHFLNAAQVYVIMQYVFYYIIDCGGFEKDKLLCCIHTSKTLLHHVFIFIFSE